MTTPAGTTAVARRVYFADTDAGGVVHHSTYVNWFEQARTEWVLERQPASAWDDAGIVFVVVRMEIDYLRPVRLNELVDVSAAVTALGNASITFAQQVARDGAVCCRASVKLACIDIARQRPVRIPAPLLALAGGA